MLPPGAAEAPRRLAPPKRPAQAPESLIIIMIIIVIIIIFIIVIITIMFIIVIIIIIIIIIMSIMWESLPEDPQISARPPARPRPHVRGPYFVCMSYNII